MVPLEKSWGRLGSQDSVSQDKQMRVKNELSKGDMKGAKLKVRILKGEFEELPGARGAPFSRGATVNLKPESQNSSCKLFPGSAINLPSENKPLVCLNGILS